MTSERIQAVVESMNEAVKYLKMSVCHLEEFDERLKALRKG